MPDRPVLFSGKNFAILGSKHCLPVHGKAEEQQQEFSNCCCSSRQTILPRDPYPTPNSLILTQVDCEKRYK